MSLADDVDIEELVMTKDELSGADIKAVCSECFMSWPSLTISRGGFAGIEGKANESYACRRFLFRYKTSVAVADFRGISGFHHSTRESPVWKRREYCKSIYL